MMFRAQDDIVGRHRKIRSFLKDDPVVAVLLAAADFEWCLNRFIISVGSRPNIEIRDTVLSHLNKHGRRIYVSGLQGRNSYSMAWLKANEPNECLPLKEIIHGDLWVQLVDALQLRHEVIHGRKGSVSPTYAETKTNIILSCSRVLNEEATRKKKRIYGGRITVKKKK